MEEYSYSININAKSIIQSKDYFQMICRRFSKYESVAFIKQMDKDFECQNQTQEKQKLIIKCFIEAQYWFGYSLFKPQDQVANIKMINIINEEKKLVLLQSKLNQIIQHINSLINDPRYKKYHQHIQWIPEILQSEDYGDFLLQLNELYTNMQKTNPSQLGYILLHQNFNENCDRLLHIASFIQYLNYLSIVNDNQAQQQEQKQLKLPKIVYLNLTGKETQKNLNFWSCFNHEYSKNCQYYALMPPTNTPTFNDQGSICFQSHQLNLEQFQNLKLIYEGVTPNIYQHTFIPLYFPPGTEQKELKKEFIDQIFLDVLKKRLTDYQPNYIFIEFLISSEISIEEEGLESLLRKLTKIAKVVVHIKIDINMEPKALVLLQKLNAIINGMQGLKSVGKIRFNQNKEKQQQIDWLKNQSLLISQSTKKCGELIFTHCQFAKQTEKKYKVKISNYFNLQIYLDGKLIIIHPKSKTNQKIEFDLESISYKHQIIVLYNQQTHTVFFSDFSITPTKIRNIQNEQDKSGPLEIELEFSEIEIEIKGENQISEPSIIITEKHIIIAYGQIKNSFNDSIQIIDRNKQEDKVTKLTRADWVNFKDESNIYSKTYFDSSNIVERIKNRRGQQVCENTILLKKQFLSFLLIGGESLEKSQIHLMNIIECVLIDLSKQTYCSLIMNKSSLSKLTSLKPWPYQVVLNYCTEQQQIAYTLILSGNNQNKINQYSFPLNPNHYNYAQLLIKIGNKIQLLNVKVQTGENYWRIEKIMNSQNNQIFIEKTDQQIVWKVFFKRIIQFKKPKLLKDLEKYEKIIQSNNFNNLVLVYLEYQIILKIKDQNNLLTSDTYEVEIKSVLQSIQNIQD